MYKYTRQQAAEILNMSTRSIDRYIKSGKLRSKKEGKIVYVKGSDVENIKGGSIQEVVKEPKPSSEVSLTKKTVSGEGILDTVYKDLKEEIKLKDDSIQNLALKLGRAEEIAKNSVSLIDYKKSQFLLEESKGYLNKEVDDLRDDREKMKMELKTEKKLNLFLIVLSVILIVVAFMVWFTQI